MPLRALFNNVEIHSYEFDALQWQKLKQEYKKQNLIMACCGQNGIPKVRKLNNFYFAHKSRSNCLCAKESAGHLYLKFLIAKIAHESVWVVQAPVFFGAAWGCYCSMVLFWGAHVDEFFVRVISGVCERSQSDDG